MRYGFVLPGGTARTQLEQAALAEASGWDGVFVWESAYGVDAWSLLAAMAVRTSRVALGTLLTPLPWRRPWKVASQALTVDALSGGRAVLSVGMGFPPCSSGSEQLELRARARLLDDGIDVAQALWRGERTVGGVDITQIDHQCDTRGPRSRIPIWVVGAWPRPKSMRRVLRCDGVIPQTTINAGTIAKIRSWLTDHGAPAGFDIVVDGETRDPSDADAPAALAEAGATWWIESRWAMPHHSDERMANVRERLKAGPPR
jgi:hypothetical protein